MSQPRLLQVCGLASARRPCPRRSRLGTSSHPLHPRKTGRYTLLVSIAWKCVLCASLDTALGLDRRKVHVLCNGADWQLCAKGAKENTDRKDCKDTGEQGKKQPKKAAAEATKGTKAAKKATGKGPGEGQKGKGKGGGGSRPAPARAAKGKTRPIVCDSDVDDCDSDYAMVYGSKSDLGWGKSRV